MQVMPQTNKKHLHELTYSPCNIENDLLNPAPAAPHLVKVLSFLLIKFHKVYLERNLVKQIQMLQSQETFKPFVAVLLWHGKIISIRKKTVIKNCWKPLQASFQVSFKIQSNLILPICFSRNTKHEKNFFKECFERLIKFQQVIHDVQDIQPKCFLRLQT